MTWSNVKAVDALSADHGDGFRAGAPGSEDEALFGTVPSPVDGSVSRSPVDASWDEDDE